jgi:4,5-dihydroxyphthalate decarboxylase
MHTVAIRREVADDHPWVPADLLTAFTEAKDRSPARLRDINASQLPVPWSHELGRQAWALLGDDPWP